MKETIIVRNSGDDFISVTTKRLKKSGVKPYMEQSEYTQFRLSKSCFRLIQNGLMVKVPKSIAKNIPVLERNEKNGAYPG